VLPPRIRFAALVVCALGLASQLSPLVLAADPFPGDLPGVEIGAGLPAGYEPSGAVWHTRLERLYVVGDAGTVSAMDADGSSVTNWSVPGDLEAICVADPAGDFAYVGVENPDGVKEFDLTTGQVTRTFDLTGTMQGPANAGLEALTFVPDDSHPEGGLFYAGLQADGKIYVFDLPIVSSAVSTFVTHVWTITPVAGRAGISGLHYDRENQLLYAVFDDSNLLRAMQSDGAFVGEWSLPGNDQEGVTLTACDMVVAEDVGKEVWSYGFPVDGGDDDGDGVANCDDSCPDSPPDVPIGPDGCEEPPAPPQMLLVS
jgi:hypothetical protein